LIEVVNETNSTLLLAYNRRFYSSVLKAQEIILEDGGVKSFNFEFTEWSHSIKTLVKTKAELQTWFLGNSSHVIDTAFYLGGKPKNICCFVSGSLDWHPKSSNFVGAGETQYGALFNYQANWAAPGRWVIEIITEKHRLLFKPLEKLQIQNIGSVLTDPVVLDDMLDTRYKPGLYLQTKNFIFGNYSRFCDIHEQNLSLDNFYLKMSNY